MSESLFFEYLFLGYIAVLVACALGFWLFFRQRDAVFRWRWQARGALIFGAVNGVYLVGVMALMSRSWAPTLGSLAIISLIVLGNVKLSIICHTCGRTNPPESLVAAKYCARCGARVAPSPVLAPAEASPPGAGEAEATPVAAGS